MTLDQAVAKVERLIRQAQKDAERKLETDLLLDRAANLDPDEITEAVDAARAYDEQALADLLAQVRRDLTAMASERP